MARRIPFEETLTLEDILSKDLELLFVGYNPSPYAVEKGHYYARKSNRFWEDLHEVGLVPRVLRGPNEDLELLEYGIGLVDLIKRPTPNIDDLSKEDFRQGLKRIDGILRSYHPKIVCFNGLGLLKLYRRSGNPPETTRVFGLPSSSPRVIGMKQQRLAALREIKQQIDLLRGN
ncbi:MAG TPA: mismatch-specific DNA-glycosylase [Chroococcales cyanobacterium]|jgi:TDG/mug DNA glycosylase family protein